MKKYPRGLQAMRRHRGFGFVVKELELCCEENSDCEFREECKTEYDSHCDHWGNVGGTLATMGKPIQV